ncbi:MAG TPA: DUF2164 domain-containing protein [Propionibacteriaceae bacterium]
MTIDLGHDTRAYLLSSIRRFFAEELDDDIGDLKAERVLEFFAKEIVPSVYNQALADAQAYFLEKATDLGNVRYEPEFDFWRKR